MKFFKYVFASALGTFLAGIILFIAVFGFLVGSITAMMDDFASDKSQNISSNSILVLSLDGPIVERAKNDDFIIPGMTEKQKGLNQIIENIDKAKEDDKIEGIYLKLSSVNTGIASVEAIRDHLIDFKESGKWIVAYGENISQSAYYIASSADEIYLHPEGMIEFAGINYKPMYMKEMFDKVGVEMQVIRGKNNKFKSAVEPFMYNEMTEANRIQSKKLIFSIWDHIVNEIAAARGIEVSAVNNVADNMSAFFPEKALKADFVDGLLHHDELSELLAEKIDEDNLKERRLVELDRYSKTKLKKLKTGDFKKKKVAVIYAVGAIESGEGDDQTIGSERIAGAIRKARKDTTVKAIVLRVNSPGGSALASDVIWRETALAKEEKPLIVSMGDYAASGGYYISLEADRIFAQPNTITGSIGVFGVIPNAQELLNEKVGVHFDGVKTNTHSDIMDISKPLSKVEYSIIQESVDRIYESFTSKVANGRTLRQTYVDSIGQGRVWTGLDAIENGLVDELGGLDEAIAYAVEQAGIENFRIKELPKQKSPIESLMEDLGMEASEMGIEKVLNNYELIKQFKYLQSIMEMKGIQAVLPIRVNL